MSIDKREITIYNLEKLIYERVCEMGREMLKNILESIDNQLMLERDTLKYRHKGKRKTTLKTIMGEVEYERAIYESKVDEKSKYIHLLDEVLGFKTVGFVSELLSEKIIEQCCDLSYRKSAKSISEMTGQSISHMCGWNVVQKLGERVDERESEQAKRAKTNRNIGQEEVKLLFEEQDGIWLNLQGKDRKKHGNKHEMKIAIAYKGAVKTGKKRYNLIGKVACANFENSNKFYTRKEGVIGAVYNLDEIHSRVLNGDGASWINRSVTDENVVFQLDTYHRNKAITTYVRNEEARKNIRKLLYSKKIDLMLEVIEAYANSCDSSDENGEKEKENFLKLLTYFKNNYDGLIPYHRRGLDLPPPPDGLVYRRCGAMESNVFSIIGYRMKRNRTNWSIKGGNNLARFLTLKSTGKLSEVLGRITTILPQKYEEEVQVALSSSKIPKTVGKGYGGVKQSSISGAPSWVRNVLGFKPIQNTFF